VKENITEIRWHGRGGQGAVTSAEALGLAAISEGKYAQAFPSFGPERRGAPVLAFNRISATEPIRNRAAIDEPDIVAVLDPSLLNIVDVTSGLKDDGTIVVNTPKSVDEVRAIIGGKWRIALVNASAIAREMLGVNIVNTTMLGAMVKATGVVDMKSLEGPLTERFGAKTKVNLAACQKAYDTVVIAEPSKMVINRAKAIVAEKMPTWKELKVGCVVTEPGSARGYRTGDWRAQHPVHDFSKCNHCGLCYIYCPEGCIEEKRVEGKQQPDYVVNMYYCKGCGVCARECAKKVITMVEES
jgi:pyruvate ferredoxin oxidoreductase gamma subunit